MGSRSRNSGRFPKLDVKTVEIPDESVGADLFPLFLSFHGLNLKRNKVQGAAAESRGAEEEEENRDQEDTGDDADGGDAEEESDAIDDGSDVFDILEGTGLLNAHTRPHAHAVRRQGAHEPRSAAQAAAGYEGPAAAPASDKRRRFHGGVVLSDDEVLSIISTQIARQETDLKLERRLMNAVMRHNRQKEAAEEQ